MSIIPTHSNIPKNVHHSYICPSFLHIHHSYACSLFLCMSSSPSFLHMSIIPKDAPSYICPSFLKKKCLSFLRISTIPTHVTHIPTHVPHFYYYLTIYAKNKNKFPLLLFFSLVFTSLSLLFLLNNQHHTIIHHVHIPSFEFFCL